MNRACVIGGADEHEAMWLFSIAETGAEIGVCNVHLQKGLRAWLKPYGPYYSLTVSRVGEEQ